MKRRWLKLTAENLEKKEIQKIEKYKLNADIKYTGYIGIRLGQSSTYPALDKDKTTMITDNHRIRVFNLV